MVFTHGGDIYRKQIEKDFSQNSNFIGISGKIKARINNFEYGFEQYPDPYCRDLRDEIGKYIGISGENVICGNGASELLASVFRTLKPKKVLLTAPSFSGYERCCQLVDAEISYYYLKENNDFALGEDYLDYMSDDVDLIVLTNPNNPTGLHISDSILNKIIKRASELKKYILIDECFIEFTEERSLCNKTMNNEYLMVLRAFTKFFAIPGIRLGYLILSNECLKNKISLDLPEWNVSSVAQDIGIASLNESEYYIASKKYINQEREYLSRELSRINIKVFPSDANFLLLKTDEDIYSFLLDNKILIRDCSNYIGLGRGFYRIAVKAHEDNECLINVISKI